MKKEIKIFIEKYVNALNDNNAAIFAGAGLSVPAGFVNWKELLRDIANELGLEIDKETDLIAIAQYHVTEKKSRAGINQKILDEFSKKVKITPNLKLLSDLPIKYFWTTNYDTLIEQALKDSNKTVDVKIEQEDLATSLSRSDAILYKMHGDVSRPYKAVITKDDYEDYDTKRQLFVTALKGDLVSKNFLFIGFSFDDPNLEYILSRIRILLGDNQRDHYCFLKVPQISDFKKTGRKSTLVTEMYNYAKLKLDYRIKDLKRYSINALLIDDYGEITEILKSIRASYLRQNILISGAASTYSPWNENRAYDFIYKLSYSLVKQGYKITTGFGSGIGGAAINGALEFTYSSKYQHIDESLILRPFPQSKKVTPALKILMDNYRKDLVANSGIAIFMFGNKLDGSKLVDSEGVIREFELSIENGVFPIPIGATGFVAQKLWDRVSSDPLKFGYSTKALKKELDTINSKSATNSTLIKSITNIIESIK